jgi:hypothetical protein
MDHIEAASTTQELVHDQSGVGSTYGAYIVASTSQTIIPVYRLGATCSTTQELCLFLFSRNLGLMREFRANIFSKVVHSTRMDMSLRSTTWGNKTNLHLTGHLRS